jgi:hypothetical protein
MTATCEMVTCDGCEAEMPEALYEACEGLCDACMRLRFVCSECEELTLKSDAHATHPAMCQDCGESKLEEEAAEMLDKAKDELDALVEGIKDSEDFAAICKAIRALKDLG